MFSKKDNGRWVKKARKPLTTGEIIQGWRAAIFKVPFSTYENNIKARVLDNVDPPPAPALNSGKSRRSAERKLLEKEYDEAETKLAKLNPRLATVQATRDEAYAGFAKMSFPPVDGKAAFAMSAGAGVLLVADGAFTFSAVADAFGADLSHGLAGASAVTLVCAAGGTFALLAVNAFSGSAVTGGPPVRRLLGGLGLLGVGATVGVIRGSAVAHPSIFLAVVNTVLSVASGALAGVAHHWIADYLKRKSEATELVRAARQPVDDAERGLAETEQQLREAVADRKRLALARDAMDAEPAQQATDDEELRRFQDARLAAAKFVYESAARFVGRRLGEEK